MRRILHALCLGAALTLLPAVAWAGDLKFGEGEAALATDEEGKLTADGAKTALNEIDRIPGEDAWDLKVWAKIDKGAPGPISIEFKQNIEGVGETIVFKKVVVQDYEGGKYVSFQLFLEGNIGFNKGRTYDVRLLQADDKGREITLAKSKLKLIDTGRKPAEGAPAEDTVSEQDKLDGLAGDDEPEETPAPTPTPEEQGPPPVEEGKKGCSVDGATDLGPNGAALLIVLGGLGLASRRRRSV
jgi:MYXO-CTERM domain-containing protein